MSGHQHAHGHAEDHGHAHGTKMTDERRIAVAFVVIFVFMLVEVVGGLIAGSLALLADAGHMVSDAAALGMSWAALRVGKRPADAARTYGYHRFEVLAAFVNGCTLFAIAAWIVFEAISRFRSPVPVMGGTMLIVAIAGLGANIAAFLILHGGDRQNLNMRSACLHVFGDIAGFLVAIVAAIVILWTGWSPIDPLLSIVITLVILKSAYQIVRSSAHILLEGVPENVDIEALRADLQSAVPPGAEIHHLHAWSMTSAQALVTLHVRSKDGDPHAIIAAIKARLKDGYGITHSTIQIEAADCVDPEC